MSHASSAKPYPRLKPLIFGTLYFLLSIYALTHFLSSSHLGDRYNHTEYTAMLDGTASRPFVYRILVPKLTIAITDAIPGQWRKQVNRKVNRWMESPDNVYTLKAMPWLEATYHVRYPFPRLVTTLLIYLAVVGYAFMLYRLAALIFEDNEAIRWFAPIFGLLAISSFSMPWQYIYDMPTLFLSTVCFYFLYVGRMKAYLVCFLIACLNKETVIFNFLFFIIWNFSRMPRSRFIAFSMAQIVIYAVIKTALTYAYTENLGFFLEFNLERVLRLDIFERSGLYKILMLCMLFFLFTYQWQKKPAFLRQALWLLPVIYVAYFFYGNGGEYRVFFDIKPLMVLLATHTLVEAAGFANAPLFNASGET